MDQSPNTTGDNRILTTLREHRVGLTAFAVAIIAMGFILASRSDDKRPISTPTPTSGQPSITVKRTGELGVLSGTPEAVKHEASKQISTFLEDFYSRAFIEPSDRGPVDLLVAGSTGPAFNGQRGAFTKGEDVSIDRGDVGFDGLLYTKDSTVIGALISVNFLANGKFTAAPERLARLSERGQLLLQPSPEGWRLAGFDVVLNVESTPTGTTASPQAISSRWMP